MTNKQRTVVFILIATVFNIVFILGLILLFSVLVLYFFGETGLSFLPFVLIACLFGGTILSQKIMNFFIRKLKWEDKMDPLFGGKNRRNRLD